LEARYGRESAQWMARRGFIDMPAREGGNAL
jgi:hypothetical protein